MGMLQLAAIVSGGGRGLQRGLEQAQTTMSQMDLLRIRDDNERARLRETFGHEFGVLSMRNANDIDKIKQELAGRKEIVGMEGQVRKDIVSQEGTQRKELVGIQQAGEEKLLDKKLSGEGALQKDRIAASREESALDRGSKEKLVDKEINYKTSEGAKNRLLESRKQQADIARDITIQSMRLQEAKMQKTDAKLDTRIDAKMDFYKKKLDGLNDLLKSSVTMTPEEVAEVKREYKSTETQINKLLGFEEQAETRKPYQFPQ